MRVAHVPSPDLCLFRGPSVEELQRWAREGTMGSPALASNPVVKVDLTPSEGCNCGLHVHEGTVYVYQKPHTMPTPLDQDRWWALTGQV